MKILQKLMIKFTKMWCNEYMKDGYKFKFKDKYDDSTIYVTITRKYPD